MGDFSKPQKGFDGVLSEMKTCTNKKEQ